jgi:hypothetical protein
MRRNEFVPENYEKVELKFNTVWETIFNVIMFVVVGLIFAIPFSFIWSLSIEEIIYSAGLFDGGLLAGGDRQRLLIVVIVVVIGIVVHELLHGVFYARYMKNGFKSIKMGVKFPYAYCESKEIMRTNEYIVGLIMPMIILGVIPAIISIFIGHAYLLLFGVFFTAAGSSDLLIFFKISKDRKSTWFENLPSINKWYVYKPSKR